MQTRLTALIASVLLAATCAASDFDSAALHENLKQILTDPEAGEVFTSEQLARLRELTGKNHETSTLDQFLRSNAQLEININPEARLSVIRTNAAAPKTACEKSNYWLIRVENQGFVTAPLTVTPADPFTEKWIEISYTRSPLTGAAVEYRILKFRSTAPGSVELSLRFDVGPGTYDLGNRSQMPILLLCNSSAQLQIPDID